MWTGHNNTLINITFLPSNQEKGAKEREREERERGCSLVGISTNYQSFIYRSIWTSQLFHELRFSEEVGERVAMRGAQVA